MLVTADRIIYDGYAYSDVGIDISDNGRIMAVAPLSQLGKPDVHFENKVLLPGMVNAHSHGFQRLLRGRTQFSGSTTDTFWTWRDSMYFAANALDPASLYTVCRQAFLEMMLHGVTTVGEFHYLHHEPGGDPYTDTNAMGLAVVEAARDVGLRISLIHTVYLHGGFDAPPNPWQQRFCDKSVDVASDRFDALVQKLLAMRDPRIAWGIGAHSLRAVWFEEVMSLKLRLSHMPFHMHVSEQQQEVNDCVKKYGARPIELLGKKDLFDACTTLVHATHVTIEEINLISKLGALVCVCPSTEADLGDGLVPAKAMFNAGVTMCLGTDDHTGMSILEEARLLEMHERLRTRQRNVLCQGPNASVAARLLEMATVNGAKSLGIETGALRYGKWADLVTYDLNDVTLQGVDGWSLLPALMFSGSAMRVRDVMVGGEMVMQEGTHRLLKESAAAYHTLARDVFRDNGDSATSDTATA